MKMFSMIVLVAALVFLSLVVLPSCSTSGSAYYGVSVHSTGGWGHYNHRPHYRHHRGHHGRHR